MPGGALRFGRATLLAGWVVFALAAILTPCIQAFPAPVSDPAQNVTQAFAGTQESLPTENADDDGSESPWCHRASAMPGNDIIPLALTANDSPSRWIAIEGVTTPSLVGMTLSKSLTQPVPPPRRLYLRTLRLLI